MPEEDHRVLRNPVCAANCIRRRIQERLQIKKSKFCNLALLTASLDFSIFSHLGIYKCRQNHSEKLKFKLKTESKTVGGRAPATAGE